MIKIITAQGTEFAVNWAGVSELDGSLRFEVAGVALESLIPVFSDKEQTKTLTRVFDDDKREFVGYTRVIRIAQMATGVVIGLMQE